MTGFGGMGSYHAANGAGPPTIADHLLLQNLQQQNNPAYHQPSSPAIPVQQPQFPAGGPAPPLFGLPVQQTLFGCPQQHHALPAQQTFTAEEVQRLLAAQQQQLQPMRPSAPMPVNIGGPMSQLAQSGADALGGAGGVVPALQQNHKDICQLLGQLQGREIAVPLITRNALTGEGTDVEHLLTLSEQLREVRKAVEDLAKARDEAAQNSTDTCLRQVVQQSHPQCPDEHQQQQQRQQAAVRASTIPTCAQHLPTQTQPAKAQTGAEALAPQRPVVEQQNPTPRQHPALGHPPLPPSHLAQPIPNWPATVEQRPTH
eukprot:GSA120T00012205001.1